MERKISPLHIIALAITSLIFIVGILVGWQMGYTADSQMKTEMEQLRSEGYMLEVLSLMRETGEASCPVLQKELGELSKRTQDYGSRLDYMEKKVGKLDPEVLRLKSDYSLMQMRNYLLLKGFDRSCEGDHLFIIYFYTNENYSPKTDQGIALDSALSSIPGERDRAAIYHFDVNVKNPLLDALKEQYSVSTVPSTIINGKKYEGFLPMEKCKEILENS